MIAVDTNLLVYAHRADSKWHTEARDAVRSLAEGPRPWMIPWPCVHEFLAIATHPRIYSPPTPLSDALRQIEYWFESPSLVVDGEGPQHLARLFNLLQSGKVTGPGVHDARIAAICIDHGVDALWSSDRDFSRFPSLPLENPLARRER